MRIKIVRVIALFLLISIALDLFYVQVIRGAYFHNLSANNHIRVVPLEAQRGVIRDRNGDTLVDNRLSYDVAVVPQDIRESEELFAFLAETLNEKKRDLLQRFFQRKVAAFAPVVIVYDVDKKVAMLLEENRFRFPGLYIQESFRRFYPFEQAGAHVLGYVGKIDNSKVDQLKEYGYNPESLVGYDGVEAYYDRYLQGQAGGQQIEVNNHGQQVRLLGVRESQKGEDLELTIDGDIQRIAAKILGEQRGSIIVMDLDTGDILGLVNSPSYNPNVFSDQKLRSQAPGILTDSSAPMLDRAVKGQYPPGSVFKAVMAMAGLDSGTISSQTTTQCPGYYLLGEQKFLCAHVHGVENLVQAIAHSCNVYFYTLGRKLDADIINKYARLFGFGERTKIDLPFEAAGLVPSKALRQSKNQGGWYTGDTLNFSIGQGDLLVTPIQLLRMMATIARSGEVVQPHLIKKIGQQEVVRLSSIKSIRIDKKYFDLVHSGLRSVVQDPEGTAGILNMDGFEVFGKTGTAQSNSQRKHHAWFVGYDLSGKQKIAFCVFLEYGGSSYHAAMLSRYLLQEMRKEEII